jgi:phosphoserine phosphatase
MFKLVIQAPEIATQNLKRLAHLTEADSIDAVRPGQLGHQAFKLNHANRATEDECRAFCEAAGYDFAFIDMTAKLGEIGLVVMDMDSTLITIECIDEIADMCGIKPQVAAITERSMRGEIDFRQSLAERVALLAGLQQEALARVYDERLQLMPGAERLLSTLHRAGIKTLLISGGFTYFTDRLKQQLGLSAVAANTLEILDGKLTGRIVGDIVDAQAKADGLIAMREQLGLRREQVIALGDGANDLDMLAAAGYGIACHAKPKVKAQAPYALDHVGLDGVLGYFD